MQWWVRLVPVSSGDGQFTWEFTEIFLLRGQLNAHKPLELKCTSGTETNGEEGGGVGRILRRC